MSAVQEAPRAEVAAASPGLGTPQATSCAALAPAAPSIAPSVRRAS